MDDESAEIELVSDAQSWPGGISAKNVKNTARAEPEQDAPDIETDDERSREL